MRRQIREFTPKDIIANDGLSLNCGQRRVKKWRAARPKLQMTKAPTAAMGVAIVQSGSARVVVTTKTNAAHTTAA